LAWFTFAAAIAARTCAMSRPRAASAVGFTRTRTAGFCPPLMLTRPTPWISAMRGARRVSARSSSADSASSSEVIARVRTGGSAGFDLL
jgi:hypothetical protein